MKSEAKVLVIGGGVVGVSALYHLAKKGWGDDVVLLEKKSRANIGFNLACCRFTALV